MRVISGQLKGRALKLPPVEVSRPVTDRSKEAVFSILGDVEDLRVLDLFAGSGALGIEAISRGAASVVAVEINPAAAEVLKANYRSLGIENCLQLYIQPVSLWLQHNQSKFDLVFADPPFDSAGEDDLDLLPELMADNATLVSKHNRRQKPLEFDGIKLVKSRRYGASQFSFYK